MRDDNSSVPNRQTHASFSRPIASICIGASPRRSWLPPKEEEASHKHLMQPVVKIPETTAIQDVTLKFGIGRKKTGLQRTTKSLQLQRMKTAGKKKRKDGRGTNKLGKHRDANPKYNQSAKQAQLSRRRQGTLGRGRSQTR